MRESLAHMRTCPQCRAHAYKALLNFVIMNLAGALAYWATLVLVWSLTTGSPWWAIPVAWVPGFYAAYRVDRWQERQDRIEADRDKVDT